MGLLAALLLSLSASANPPPLSDHLALFRLWQGVNTPSQGLPEPIGGYSGGCLVGAERLPLDGPGFSVMRPSRRRYYGHPALVTYIRELARSLQKEKLPLLLVGDLGRPRGGPMLSGHASHQTGLDVDLWYRLSERRPTARERERWGAGEYVRNRVQLTRGWRPPQRRLVALAAQREEVDRVFVNPAIKRDLCGAFPNAPWLHKVRAWYGHGDHLHVRLRCPAGSRHCEPQEPLDPAQPQCGEDLAWWFSKEAEEEGRKKQLAFQERQFPRLPEACANLVSDLHARSR